MTGIGLAAARGVIAVLGNYNVMGLTTFATNILTMLGIAAATDYGIFLFGRYREARQTEVVFEVSQGESQSPGHFPAL